MRRAIVVALTLGAVAAPAISAESVIGAGRAQVCFKDAERDYASDLAVRNCTDALDQEALSRADRVATHVNRGILRHRLGQSEAALADYDRALALGPTEAEAYLNKAATLFKLEGRWREALPLFTAALERKTRRPEIAYFGRGLTHELAGDLRAAYADLKKASELAPEWELPARELARYSVKSRG